MTLEQEQWVEQQATRLLKRLFAADLGLALTNAELEEDLKTILLDELVDIFTKGAAEQREVDAQIAEKNAANPLIYGTVQEWLKSTAKTIRTQEPQ